MHMSVGAWSWSLNRSSSQPFFLSLFLSTPLFLRLFDEGVLSADLRLCVQTFQTGNSNFYDGVTCLNESQKFKYEGAERRCRWIGVVIGVIWKFLMWDGV